MKLSDNLIEDLLSRQDSSFNNSFPDVWEPGFDADRQLVATRLGSYRKLFQRPDDFVKRFYHRLYPLPIENWQLTAQTSLYGGFCSIDTRLEIRFQPTCKYAIANSDALPDINQHIKTTYDGLIRDAITKELLNLADGRWIMEGLQDVEKSIANSVNEALMLRNIQCRTVCVLQPGFQELTEADGLDARFAHEAIYLRVEQKNFQFREHQQQEKLRQQQALRQQELEHQREQLEIHSQQEHLKRLQQAQEAENAKQLLQEKERQQAEQFAIEECLHRDRIAHERHLRELAKEAENQELIEQQNQQQELEKRLQEEKFAHETLLKEQELEHEIALFKKQQRQWNQAKESLHQEKLKQEHLFKAQEQAAQIRTRENETTAELKMQELLMAEKLKHENRLKEMQLQAEVEEHERRFLATEKTDAYLRREIELLVLEQRRAELNRSIQQAQQQNT